MTQTPQTSQDPAASSHSAGSSPTPRVPLWLRFARSMIHLGFTLLACPWFRVRATNVPKIIPGKPVIIAPNHVSFLDPPVIQRAVGDHVTFMMTEVIYRSRLFGWIFKVWGAIPVPEDRAPTAAMKAALRALRAGETVVIFPEGKISGDGCLDEGQGGVGMLIAKGRVPVIPAAILGTYEVLPRHRWWPRRHRVVVHFGDPIQPDEIDPKNVPVFIERLMGEIEALGAPRRPAEGASGPAG